MSGPVVYAIRCTETGRVKLGWSRDLDRRLAHLRRMSPTPLELVATLDGDRHHELALHRHFAEYRRHGEWFDLPVSQVERLRAGVFPAGARKLQADAYTRRERQLPLRCTHSKHATINMLVAGVNNQRVRAIRAAKLPSEAAR